MITMQDIKEVYSKYTEEDLNKIYTDRQNNNINLNNMIAKNILLDFPMETLYIPKLLSDSEKLNYLLAIFLNSNNPNVIRTIFEMLKKYNYNDASELLKTIQRTDLYFSQEIDFITFTKLLYSATTIDNIKGASLEKVSLASTYGNILLYPLDKMYDTSQINISRRSGFCHNLTSEVLLHCKDLYGAYYYIPLEFAGLIEHSVLLDLKHNLVLDLANNIVVPLDIWEKFYPHPFFIIKGEEFSALSKASFNELGIYLTTCSLNNVKRIRTK